MAETKIVQSIERKTTSKDTPFWKIIWTDGKSDNIFNDEWVAMLEISREKGIGIQFTTEPNPNPKYRPNIKTMALVGEAKPEQITYKQTPQSASDDRIAIVEKQLKTVALSKDEQIERAVWIKECGECIRSGAINKETPAGLEMMVWYYTEMRRVCGIMIGKEVNVKQKNTLVDQAKKQGAVEVNE